MKRIKGNLIGLVFCMVTVALAAISSLICEHDNRKFTDVTVTGPYEATGAPDSEQLLQSERWAEARKKIREREYNASPAEEKADDKIALFETLELYNDLPSGFLSKTP